MTKRLKTSTMSTSIHVDCIDYSGKCHSQNIKSDPSDKYCFNVSYIDEREINDEKLNEQHQSHKDIEHTLHNPTIQHVEPECTMPFIDDDEMKSNNDNENYSDIDIDSSNDFKNYNGIYKGWSDNNFLTEKDCIINNQQYEPTQTKSHQSNNDRIEKTESYELPPNYLFKENSKRKLMSIQML
ncbi:hypothetical protein QTN25_000941 [Entamoeba marina]